MGTVGNVYCINDMGIQFKDIKFYVRILNYYLESRK